LQIARGDTMSVSDSRNSSMDERRVVTYRGKWAGVSGYIEESSTSSQQAWTEIKEEAGLDVDDVEMVQEGLPLEVVDSEIGRKWIAPEEIGRHETVPKLPEAWQRVAP
jgi:8-oxo-dGTP diphosphatase